MPLRLALRGYSVASLPWRFALRASRFALAFSVASLPRNFQKKKCVSINSKWSKTHKNAKKKKFTLLTGFARSERSERRSATFTYPCGRFAPSGFALRARILSRFSPSGFALATYPMTLPGSQGVSMPSVMLTGPKLW